MEQELNGIITQLQNQINALNERQQQLLTAQPAPVEEYRDLTFHIQRAEDVSLNLFKTLPEFSGDRTAYATWRTIVKTAMKLLENHEASMQFCQALMIVRNKITGAASNILNNYNTPFNFNAIIDRLDFTYADKRPLYVLEQQLLVLQQNRLSIDEFYDAVNEKLNAIVNKINMTHSETATARAFIESVNEKALRTFVTGLNHRKGEILYASNPSSLPEAYAKLQTIINDQERMKFANQYHGRNNRNQDMGQQKNPRFRLKNSTPLDPNNVQLTQSSEPMDIDQSSTRVHVEQSNLQIPPNPMNSYISKRNLSLQNSNQRSKQQRFNNIEDPTPYAKSIIQEHTIPEETDDTASCTSENSVSTKASIFLGE